MYNFCLYLFSFSTLLKIVKVSHTLYCHKCSEHAPWIQNKGTNFILQFYFLVINAFFLLFSYVNFYIFRSSFCIILVIILYFLFGKFFSDFRF